MTILIKEFLDILVITVKVDLKTCSSAIVSQLCQIMALNIDPDSKLLINKKECFKTSISKTSGLFGDYTAPTLVLTDSKFDAMMFLVTDYILEHHKAKSTKLLDFETLILISRCFISIDRQEWENEVEEFHTKFALWCTVSQLASILFKPPKKLTEDGFGKNISFHSKHIWHLKQESDSWKETLVRKTYTHCVVFVNLPI